MKKSILKRAVPLILAVGICIGLCSCSTPFSTEIVNTEINQDGELIVYFSDGSSQNAGKVANNEVSITVEGNGGDVSSAAAMGVMSAVSIKSNFVSNSGSFLPGFGIIGGSGNQYYSAGAGVIYQIDGDRAFIITNHHVVYDSGSRNGISDDIEIFLYGKEEQKYAISAEYVGGSSYYDIAVLYAEDSAFRSGTVRAAQFFEGDVSVGQTAIAVGNPQGYGISASLGIVSVASEYISNSESGRETQRAIRVDTAVNSGNSGGGLYDENGRLIGIVNAKIIDESVENIGYAIPSDVVLGVTGNIIRNCFNKSNTYVKRAMLGTNLAAGSVSTVVGEDGNIDIVETVVVSSVTLRSPAYGVLDVGDIILEAKIGERTAKIERTHHLIDFMLFADSGDRVELTIKRNGETLTKSITITSNAIVNY